MPSEPTTLPDLVHAWDTTHRDLLALGRALDDRQWLTMTGCPGWTVGDVIAHNAWIEGVMAGSVDPPHEVDWSRHPHATTDFTRACEVPVDLRRSRTRTEVLDELESHLDRRRHLIADGPQQLDAEVPGPWGTPVALERAIRMRTFDGWVHEFDIRTALGTPGHLDSPGAWLSSRTLRDALPFVWGKKAAAPLGTSVLVTVTGPGVEFTEYVVRGEDGRAASAPSAGTATVAVTMSWPDLVSLGCGRAEAAQVRGGIAVEGDAELAERFLSALAITP